MAPFSRDALLVTCPLRGTTAWVAPLRTRKGGSVSYLLAHDTRTTRHKVKHPSYNRWVASAPDGWLAPDDDLRERIRETDRKIADGSIWDDVWSAERFKQELARLQKEVRKKKDQQDRND